MAPRRPVGGDGFEPPTLNDECARVHETRAGRTHPAQLGVPPRANYRGRMSVRERAAAALDDDFPDVLEALRRGLKDKDAGKAARTAIAYVQLVYGRQLQQPADETPPSVEELDVSRMTIAERESLKRRILARHPHLAEEILGDDA
jgi:hypothetical protein